MEPYSLDEALARIAELEAENKALKERLAVFESKLPSGRHKHDAKWQQSYDCFVTLYEQGQSIEAIVEVSDFSRRTAYRYKEYYDKMHS